MSGVLLVASFYLHNLCHWVLWWLVTVISLEEHIFCRIVSELKTHLALGNAILLAKSDHQTSSRQQQAWTTLLNLSVPVSVGQPHLPWLTCYSPITLLLMELFKDKTNRYCWFGKLLQYELKKTWGCDRSQNHVFVLRLLEWKLLESRN